MKRLMVEVKQGWFLSIVQSNDRWSMSTPMGIQRRELYERL